MLPREALEVVPFDTQKGDIGALEQRSFLAETWKRAFQISENMETNLSYLEARLHELLRDEGPLPIIPADPAAAGASPFTQRLANLIDRMEEQVLRVESLQRRLDV